MRNDALAAAVSGVVSLTAAYPFELLKTRAHFVVGSTSAGASGMSSIKHLCSCIYRERGFISFYKGYDQLLPSAVIKSTLRFSAFHNFKQPCAHLFNISEDSTACNIICGALTALVETTVIVQPTERGKVLRADGKSPMNVIRCDYENYGLSRALQKLYSGYSLCLLRQAGNQAISFSIFYTTKARIVRENPGDDVSLLEKTLLGFTAGASAATATMPIDVLKTTIQREVGKKTPSVMHHARQIFAVRGFRGFYFGLLPRILRVGTEAAVSFLCFDTIQSWVGSSV